VNLQACQPQRLLIPPRHTGNYLTIHDGLSVIFWNSTAGFLFIVRMTFPALPFSTRPACLPSTAAGQQGFYPAFIGSPTFSRAGGKY